MHDELDARIRALDAERLRPVPPPPDTVPRSHTAPVDELDARRHRRRTTALPPNDGIKALQAAGEKYRAKQAQHEEGGH